MTFLIASSFAHTVEEAEALAASAWSAGADVVEVRIDAFREAPKELTRFLKGHPDRNWLITCRSRSEGGYFAGNGIEAAARALEVVEGTSAWVDIELAAWRADGALRQRALAHLQSFPSARAVISAHFFEGAGENLAGMAEEILREGPQVVAKLAYAGEHISDSFHAFDLMHRHGQRIVAICMGEAGAWTRVLAKKLGAFATFASLDPAESTAPGQWSIQELRENYGWDRINGDTRVFGVVGDPIAHSLSPRLFHHWFEQHNGNAMFVPLRVGVEHGGLAQFLAECERRPWLQLSGVSVTIPHKIDALQWAGEAADPMSRGIGAANTLVLGDAGPAAYNTDCYAAVDSLAAALGRPRNELAGLVVDVLGAGGAARAVCYGLAEMGCRVTVFSRSHRESQDFHGWGVAVRDWVERVQSTGDVLVNCTPVGMWPRVNESPMPIENLRGRRLVFDLIYRPLETKLLADAAALGCPTLSGLDMFVRQAATQFALWTGISPDTPSAYEMLKADLQGETERRRCVVLIGARGSGKTVVGAMLANLLRIRHVDTDDVVVESCGKTITEIFAEEGEAGFRRRESEAVRSAMALAPAVVSVGGGAVLDPGNVAAFRRAAQVVWLAAPPDVLAQRIAADAAAGRPALTSRGTIDEVAEVLRGRESLYRVAADFIVDTTSLDAAQVARRIADWMGKDSSLCSE